MNIYDFFKHDRAHDAKTETTTKIIISINKKI